MHVHIRRIRERSTFTHRLSSNAWRLQCTLLAPFRPSRQRHIMFRVITVQFVQLLQEEMSYNDTVDSVIFFAD